MIILIRLLLVVFLTATAQVSLGAGEDNGSAGPSLEPIVSLEELRPLKLVGESRLRFAFFEIFRSALFTSTGEWNNPKTSFRFELTYSRAISGERLALQTSKEWDHLGFQDVRRENWELYLTSIWPAVSKGDKITFDVDENGVSRFFFNERWMGEVADPAFAPAFIAIWLSPETSRPAHREGLLADS